MSNYNSIYHSMMGNHIENFQQLDPNMMTISSSSMAMPPMDNYEPPMSMDMMNSMVKENFDDGEVTPTVDPDLGNYFGGSGNYFGGSGNYNENECPGGENCDDFTEVSGDGDGGDDAGSNPYTDECTGDHCDQFTEVSGDGDDDQSTTLGNEPDECPEGQICESFEEVESESDSEVEPFENNENKDMELWTCYPSNKENFENSNDSLFFKADGNVAAGSSNKSSIHPEDREMSRLYMYLAIAVVALMVVYLLTNNKH